MKIEKIIIENVKGISKHEFNFSLIPNKPNFFVAPNGFGKSSFGVAFDSLKKTKIDLHKNHFHRNNVENLPSISITVNEDDQRKSYVANDSQNEINEHFDTFVINSQLIAKASIADIKGKKIAKPSLEIGKTVLIETIPKKVTFDYSVAIKRKIFGTNQKIAKNISTVFANSLLMRNIADNISFSKLKSKKFFELLDKISNYSGTAVEIKTSISDEIIGNIAINELNSLCEILKNSDIECISDEVDILTSALQIIHIANELGSNFKKAVKYLDYVSLKKEYEEVINGINSTRFEIKPKEEGKKLVIEWPKAFNISNGQRDILTLSVFLNLARKSFKRKNCILIIDEVFDYLDDANLVTFQYYISNFIEEMSKNKNLFPIILTHLDPAFFNHFCFSDKKMHIHYLKDTNNKSSKNILKIIYNREKKDLKEQLDKYYFHFHTDISCDLTQEFKKYNLPDSWCISDKFHKKVQREFRTYVFEPGNEYDPLMVCVAIRTIIEELAYNELNNIDYQETFLNEIHGTKNKLNYCIEKGRKIPELYFLLGIIYNTSLHLKEGEDISIPLSLKLENFNIKQMIQTVVNEYSKLKKQTVHKRSAKTSKTTQNQGI